MVWIIPAHLLTADDVNARTSTRPFDLPAEIERFGRSEAGGIGVSVPAPAPTTKVT